MTHSRCLMMAACLAQGLSGPAGAQSIGDVIEYELEARLQSESPIADGEVTENEYASSEFLSFVDLENPGNPYPPLNQMCGAEFVVCNDEDPVEGDEDLSATVYWGYTADAFFMAFEVTDQMIDADEGAEPWNNDGVELFIDADGDGADERNWSLEAMQLVADTVNPGFTSGAGPAWVESDPVPGEWSHAIELTDEGYVMEFEFPLGSLDMISDDFQTIDPGEAEPVEPGHTMRMNFAINDMDVEFAGQGDGTHAMWWVYEENPASPFGGAEGNWVVGMTLGDPVEEPSASLRRGDCNGDGDVNLADAVCVLNWLFAGTGPPGCVAATNTNGDGAANITDATYLLNHLFSGGPAPVAPFPDCGPGELPADEELGCEQSCG